MAFTQNKALVPLLIFRILEEFSDEKHPLTREEIERILDERYNITMERKTFFRHIEHLMELNDIDIRRVIVKPKNAEKNACAGFYLADRMFSEAELRVIIDSLSGSRYLSQWETEDLVHRLSCLSTRHFRKKMSAYQFVGRSNKTENKTLLLNLEIIDEAIEERKQIRFDLLRTENDGRKVLSEWRNETCTPIRYFVKEQNYYLVGIQTVDNEPHVVSYILSNIVNVEKTEIVAQNIRSLPEFKNGIDWQEFLRKHPALDNLRGRPERCTFLCYRWMLDEVKSFFGDEIRIRQLSKEENEAVAGFLVGATKNWLVEVSVITDPNVAIQFAWCRPLDIWLVSPTQATQTLCRRLECLQNRYTKLENR